MSGDPLPFFLALARDWRTAADALRAVGIPESDPALRVWREAAWCHVLFARGQYHGALASLRAVVRALAGESPDDIPLRGTADEAVSAAVELLDRIRATVMARDPRAFGSPAAA